MHDIRTGLGVKNMSDLTIKNFFLLTIKMHL